MDGAHSAQFQNPSSDAYISQTTSSTQTHEQQDCTNTVECLEVPKFFHNYCGCTDHSPTISFAQTPDDKVRIYRSEWRKTVLTFMGGVTVLFMNHLVLAIASEIISRDPLPDLFHSMFEQTTISRHLADGFASIGVFSTMLILGSLHKHRSIVLRRFFYIGGLVYLMRALSIGVTHIPAAYKNNHQICVPPTDDANPTVSDILSNFGRISITFGLQVEHFEGRLFCGDMLFSGHTTALSTSCFFLNYYLPHSLWPLKFIVVSICGVAMACLVTCRSHYSVDVIMGYWISSIFFSIYHAFCEISHESRPKMRPFRRLFIFWTMFELEVNVPAGRMPNEIQWPMNWPQCAVDFVDNWNNQNLKTKAGRTARWLSANRIKFHM